MDVSGKVGIITGASAGIGLATVRQFATAGAKLVLATRSADKLAALAQELTQQGQSNAFQMTQRIGGSAMPPATKSKFLPNHSSMGNTLP